MVLNVVSICSLLQAHSELLVLCFCLLLFVHRLSVNVIQYIRLVVRNGSNMKCYVRCLFQLSKSLFVSVPQCVFKIAIPILWL